MVDISLQAAGQYVKVEKLIFEALAEIPDITKGARSYVEVYAKRRDQTLERTTFDLFLAIMKALCHIMQFFADGSIRKTFESTFKQSGYKSELFKSIEEIRRHEYRIKEEAQQCLAWAMNDQELAIQSANTSMDTKFDITFGILGHIPKVLEQWIPKPMGYGSALRPLRFDGMMLIILAGDNSGAMDQPLEALRQLHPSLHSGETGSDSNITWSISTTYLAVDESVSDNIQKGQIERAKRLPAIIKCDPELIQRDIRTYLQLGSILDEKEEARVAALVRDSAFKTYMAGRSLSNPLFVNGRADPASANGPFPLSLVVGTLAQASLETSKKKHEPGSFFTGYFCERRRSDLESPIPKSVVRMLTSFVGQLLDQLLDRNLGIDLSILNDSEWKKPAEQKLDTLWKALRLLISQMPLGSVLICIINEISQYETSVLEEDTDRVVRRLTRLVFQYFEDHTIDLDEHIESEDSSEWWIESATSLAHGVESAENAAPATWLGLRDKGRSLTLTTTTPTTTIGALAGLTLIAFAVSATGAKERAEERKKSSSSSSCASVAASSSVPAYSVKSTPTNSKSGYPIRPT
ncbi:hypothetical protein SCUP234_12958 [Seiridium cupressi]